MSKFNVRKIKILKNSSVWYSQIFVIEAGQWGTFFLPFHTFCQGPQIWSVLLVHTDRRGKEVPPAPSFGSHTLRMWFSRTATALPRLTWPVFCVVRVAEAELHLEGICHQNLRSRAVQFHLDSVCNPSAASWAGQGRLCSKLKLLTLAPKCQQLLPCGVCEAIMWVRIALTSSWQLADQSAMQRV